MTNSNNYVRQARVDGIWGAVPDRRELLRTAGPTPPKIVMPSTATTSTEFINASSLGSIS